MALFDRAGQQGETIGNPLARAITNYHRSTKKRFYPRFVDVYLLLLTLQLLVKVMGLFAYFRNGSLALKQSAAMVRDNRRYVGFHGFAACVGF